MRIASAIGAGLLTLSSSAYAGFEDGEQFRLRGEFRRAYVEYREDADKGHARAQFWLGYFHEIGAGAIRDLQAARQWYEKSARGGDAEAALYLAVLNVVGNGTPSSYEAAMPWFKQAEETATGEVREKFFKQIPPGFPENDLARAYYRALTNVALRNARFPRQALRQNTWGETRVKVVLRSGAIEVTQSSGSAVLDSAAEQVVRYAYQAVPLPTPLQGVDQAVEFPFVFSLAGNP